MVSPNQNSAIKRSLDSLSRKQSLINPCCRKAKLVLTAQMRAKANNAIGQKPSW